MHLSFAAGQSLFSRTDRDGQTHVLETIVRCVRGGGRNFCTALLSENFVCDALFITDVQGLTSSYSLETTTMIFLDSSMHFTVQFRMIPCDLIVRLLLASKREGKGLGGRV